MSLSCSGDRRRVSNSPTRTTVASAFSGIFCSSFSSCLDLDRCMLAIEDGSLCWEQTGQGVRSGGRTISVIEIVGPHPSFRTTCPSFFSMSTRVSVSTAAWTVPMSGSVTDGSGWAWLGPWWCVRLAAEMFLGKGLVCSFSSLGWLGEAERGRERVSRRRRGRERVSRITKPVTCSFCWLISESINRFSSKPRSQITCV